LFAGRVILDKGVKEFVEAAKIIKREYKNIEFQMLGFIDPSNPNAVPYEDIQKWQKRNIISYLGETEDVRPYLDDSSCLVFPSFYNEGISRILLEAAAMAKPIITTDNVGCRDVVKDNYNGFICKIKDKNDLVLKIRKFMTLTQKEQELMGLNGRKVVLENFNEEQIIKIYTDYLSSHFKQNQNRKTTLIYSASKN
jgi:glycosyltransferase involved in cell wall biosynthesis